MTLSECNPGFMLVLDEVFIAARITILSTRPCLRRLEPIEKYMSELLLGGWRHSYQAPGKR